MLLRGRKVRLPPHTGGQREVPAGPPIVLEEQRRRDFGGPTEQNCGLVHADRQPEVEIRISVARSAARPIEGEGRRRRSVLVPVPPRFDYAAAHREQVVPGGLAEAVDE